MAEFLGGYTPGFRGSVRIRATVNAPWKPLMHAVSRRNHHLTVCGIGMDTKVDEVNMAGNGNMQTVNCLLCWLVPDPFP